MDSALPSPNLLTYNDGQLYVFDSSLLRLVALNASDGSPLWRVGRSGQGPLEFAGVASLIPEESGGVAIVDIRNRRVQRVGGDGHSLGSVPLGEAGMQPNQLCPFGKNHYLIADVFKGPLLMIDTAGKRTGELPSLWPDLDSAGVNSRQLLVRNNVASTCLLALMSGRGFAIVSPNHGPIISTYVEPFEVYGVGARKREGEIKFVATIDAEFVGDTLYILFAGRTKDRYRLVDRYSSVSGAYIDTYRLPFQTDELAAGMGSIFVIDSSGTTILALRPKPRR